MRILTLALLLIHFSAPVISQVIYGIVLDSHTKDTISFATVYFNGTFSGTYTNEHGRFTMDLSGHKAMPLSVSAIGYYSATITDFSAPNIIVYLEPKVYEMQEVVVNAESLLNEREANLRIFRREFLGSSPYARRCIILNEKDLTFNYGEDSDTLKAYAKNVLHIYNPLLGYKIACFLDEFRFNRTTCNLSITGFIFFEQDLVDSMGIKKVAKRRRHAYLGSTMHFFRSLYNNDLQKQGFSGVTLFTRLKGKTLYKKTVTVSDSIKYFGFNGDLTIYYNNNPTNLKFISSPVAFNQTGQYDFTLINWKGKMADYRVGDWLPLEYRP